MVSAMASAYNGLSEEEREKVFMLAVGKFDYESLDQNFCMGFAACHDESDGSWWTTWSAAQRDVFFYIKTDPNDDNSWEFFCRYSMNVGRDEFDDTIREMLTIAATNNVPDVVEVVADVVGFEITEDDLVDGGNETSIETVGEGNETSIEMETPSLEPVGAMSDPSRSYVSAALPSATFIPSLMLVAAVLASSIV